MVSQVYATDSVFNIPYAWPRQKSDESFNIESFSVEKSSYQAKSVASYQLRVVTSGRITR